MALRKPGVLMAGKRQIMQLTVNGDEFQLLVSPRQTMLDVIRDGVGLSGTKEGCTTGSCGVCTVNNDQGEAVLSCLTPALEWDGKSIYVGRDRATSMRRRSRRAFEVRTLIPESLKVKRHILNV